MKTIKKKSFPSHKADWPPAKITTSSVQAHQFLFCRRKIKDYMRL